MRRLIAAAVLAAAAGATVSCAGPREPTLVAEFADVGDLVNRANVQMSDTVVGRVQSIELDGWKARVTMVLEPGTRVPERTAAEVRSTSLLGEKFVDLQPPRDGGASAKALPDGAVIPLDRTGKTPEVEEVFTQLGGILSSGALEDLGALTSATARIVEGQEDDIGRVLDGTAKLVASLARERRTIADALTHLSSASKTLAGGTETFESFLATTADVGEILAAQRGQLEELIVQLDRLGEPSARLLEKHRAEMDRAIKALLTIVPQVHAARADLGTSLEKLPTFARLFNESIPGDYIQLDVHG